MYFCILCLISFNFHLYHQSSFYQIQLSGSCMMSNLCQLEGGHWHSLGYELKFVSYLMIELLNRGKRDNISI